MEFIKRFFGKIGAWIGHHKKLTIGIAAGAVVLCVAFWLVGWPVLMRGKLQDNGEAISFIRTTTLTKTSLEDTISATGTVESANVSNVSTQLKYTVKSVEVQVGDDVVEGDVICILDTGDLNEQIEKERERMAEQLESLEEAVERAEENLANIDSNAYTQYSSAKTKYDAANEEYTIVAERIKDEETDYNTAKTNYDTAYKELLAVDGSNREALVNYLQAQTTNIDDSSTADALFNSYYSDKTASTGTLAEAEKKLIDTYIKKVNTSAALTEAKEAVGYNSIYETYASALNALNSADASLDTYYDRVQSAQDSLDEAEEALGEGPSSDTLDDLLEQLEDCTLRAETSGKVTTLNVTVGDVANGTVATIQDTKALKISISIAEYDIASVEVGMKAIITSDSIDGELTGVLSQISPVASGGGGSSSTFAAEVSVDGNGGGLHIGVNAKVEIVLSTTDDVFVVPIDAVEYPDNSGRAYVYVKTGGEGVDATFEQVEVETGASTDYYIEIYGDNVEEGMEVRSSADLEEAMATDDSAQGNMGFNMGGMMGGMPNMGGNGGGMPSMPSGGGMPSGGPPSGGGGGMPSFG